MITQQALNIPPAVLRSFVMVASLKSFTLASSRLGLQQSTISQHIRKLEEAVGRKLFMRDTHSVSLTGDGDAMVEFARNVLEATGRMERFFSTKVERSRLHLGISEDFAVSGLADVLSMFQQQEPYVDLELTVGLSGFLYQRFDAGELDVIFVKRRPGDKRGDTAWRDDLVWIGKPGLHLEQDAPVPLVAYAPPSITRSLAIESLENANRSWRVSCSSGSLNGLHAALLAGLGVAAHSNDLIPRGLVPVMSAAGLPRLPTVEFVAIGPGKGNRVALKMLEMLLMRQHDLARARPPIA